MGYGFGLNNYGGYGYPYGYNANAYGFPQQDAGGKGGESPLAPFTYEAKEKSAVPAIVTTGVVLGLVAGLVLLLRGKSSKTLSNAAKQAATEAGHAAASETKVATSVVENAAKDLKNATDTAAHAEAKVAVAAPAPAQVESVTTPVTAQVTSAPVAPAVPTAAAPIPAAPVAPVASVPTLASAPAATPVVKGASDAVPPILPKTTELSPEISAKWNNLTPRAEAETAARKAAGKSPIENIKCDDVYSEGQAEISTALQKEELAAIDEIGSKVHGDVPDINTLTGLAQKEPLPSTPQLQTVVAPIAKTSKPPVPLTCRTRTKGTRITSYVPVKPNNRVFIGGHAIPQAQPGTGNTIAQKIQGHSPDIMDPNRPPLPPMPGYPAVHKPQVVQVKPTEIPAPAPEPKLPRSRRVLDNRLNTAAGQPSGTAIEDLISRESLGNLNALGQLLQEAV